MQKLRDSGNIARYARYIKDLEEECRLLSKELLERFEKPYKKLLITYHRHGYLPASIMYWYTVTMDSELHVLFDESNTLTYYILPYSEKGFIILYSSNPYASSTLNLLQTARLTGYDVLVITLKPRDERIENMYSRYKPLYVDHEELEAVLVMSIATYYALSKHYRDRLGSRGKRLYSHVEEGLSPIIEELINKYLDQLEQILGDDEVVVTSSKLLEPVALYFVEVLKRLGKKAYYQNPEYVTGYGSVLLLSTSVEEYYVRELKFKFNVMNISLRDIVLNTDPLEAQIYLSLLAYYLIYSSTN